jgi:hypothetical protein
MPTLERTAPRWSIDQGDGADIDRDPYDEELLAFRLHPGVELVVFGADSYGDSVNSETGVCYVDDLYRDIIG